MPLLIDGALDDLVAEGALPAGLSRKNVTVEPPRDPRMAILRPTLRWCSPSPLAPNPRALAELIKAKLEAMPRVISVEIAGPGFINLRLAADAWRDELRTILNEGDALRPVDARQERAGQCRICLGQSDRADAHGPLPGRRSRRRSRADLLDAAGFRVTKRILCQRCRGAGRYARALGAPAYREALGEDIGEIPKASIPATI